MIRGTANNARSLHALVARCCDTLSCPVPDIYLTTNMDVNKLVLLVSIMEHASNTHPFVPVRLNALKGFAAGKQYAQLLAGNYLRNTAPPADAAPPSIQALASPMHQYQPCSPAFKAG